MLADWSEASLATIQRMEAGRGRVRQIDTQILVVEALDRVGIELIGDGATGAGDGRGVGLETREKRKVG